MPTLAEIREITDQYAECHLECGGMSLVFHFYLCNAAIPHVAYEGTIHNQKNGREFTPHIWIEVSTVEGEAVVDYRAHMWLGTENRTPHGVFLKSDYPHMSYEGKVKELPLRPLSHIVYMVDHFGYDDTPPPPGLILLDPFTGQRVQNSRPLPYQRRSPYGPQVPFLPAIAR